MMAPRSDDPLLAALGERATTPDDTRSRHGLDLLSRLKAHGLLLVVVLVFTGSLLLTFQRIKDHHAMELLVDSTPAWLASQAELELERLRHAVDGYVLGVAEVDRYALLGQYEVFKTRLPPLIDEMSRATRPVSDLAEVVKRLETDLAQIGGELGVLRRGDRIPHQRISGRLAEFAQPLRELALEAHTRVGQISAERTARRQALYAEQEASLVGMLASGGLLVVLFYREARRTRDALAEARAAQAQIRYIAQHDPLTHVPNRWLFADRLDQALRRARRDGQLVALHCIDLDHFKSVNDTLGHLAGDRLLVSVAQRLRACLRESDTLARIGGDEFAIVQVGLTDVQGATRLGERILEELRAPIDLGTGPFRASVSIGIALYPPDGADAAALLHAADNALYEAKDCGRGTFRLFRPGPRPPATAGPDARVIN